MAYVTPSTQNIKGCFQVHYSLPYFQREYKWESRHFTELLNDVQSAFLENFEPTLGRKHVANYAPYFLGSIITSSAVNGKRPLIDGQQRLTSAFLIMAYLDRYKDDNGVKDAFDLSSLIGSMSFGQKEYAIEFSETRKEIFDKYLDRSRLLPDILADIEDIPNLDSGDKKIIEALRTIDTLLNADVKESIEYFIDYFAECVLLIDIGVVSESEAHRVFVTMNDRGLRLGPIDLLKGQILSKIPDPTESFQCHSRWLATMNSLRELDAEEDSLFFRNLFRSQWAQTMRGKSRGDEAGDYDVIGDAYHRWFQGKFDYIGLNTADDFARFARDDIPKFAEIYRYIKKAETEFTNGAEYIFYNAMRRYGFQSMVLMAPVALTDTPSEWKKKINLCARYIDILLTSRTIEGKDNNYDNLKEISFSLTKDLRGKSSGEVLAYVRDNWSAPLAAIQGLGALRYTRADRSDILYVLARVAAYLEDAFALTNRVGFSVYWQRDRGGKTFDIEHLLCEKFDSTKLPFSHGFADAKDYADRRNLIGALVLLPRSRNRSLQDKPYSEKISAYATENVLTQTLCDSLYLSNPNVTDFLSDHAGLKMSSLPQFGAAEIELRGKLYSDLAKLIWAVP
ncbi:MAG: DUF262 domain-containing protein [Phyllobacteriaceae bacterium]|nr:DUF262 domain-containing protein [Phyllobacteriaceae bacterium]